ncbi:MAG: transglycosylase domain-containing protein [Eubacterium sp.]
MASNDYDDLLESFMNNSQKVYNEDKDALEKKSGNLPSSYNVTSKDEKKDSKSNKSSNRKKRKPKKPINSFFNYVLRFVLAILMIIGVVGVVCLSVITIYGYTVVYGDAVFDLQEEATSQNQTSFIYGYDDEDNLVQITRLHGEENRIWLDLDNMTNYLPEAFIAIEDERFENHHGVDWKRTIGVTVTMSGQGGSTITQQLIKNLTDENSVTFVRKFNEILSALNLEKNYSKEQIIEAYLNTIYLSHGCYGVKTAAETYFGKDVDKLNIAECACLAAITKYPTKYDPLLNPENNKERQEWILYKMNELGYITDAEYKEALDYELVFTNSENYKGSQVTKDAEDLQKEQDEDVINSYYTDYVIDEVLSDLQKMGYSEKKARKMLYGGGLKIYSAVDFDIQEQVEKIYENREKMADDEVQGACVVMDYNGRILGIVGGAGKKKLNRGLNRASQSTRQPGSTIKPLSVYGPAIQKSLEDDSVDIYWSTPTKDAPLMNVNGKPWPTNEGGGYSNGMVTVQKGLANSMNTISAQTLDKIGVDYAFDFITNKFHISTLDAVIDNDYAPMATGSLTHGVSVLEMTTAYQAFGNGGYYYGSYSYYKIEDSKGNVLIEKNPEDTKQVALAENSAGVMNKLLQTVMTSGTGRYYKISGVECFGKTGTTTDSKDRWFIGGTPEYVVGVWYGYDIPKEIVYNYSYNPCGTIWNLVMNNIYDKKGIHKEEFDTPEGVVQREYSYANGLLCKGTGNWGWFDENNLPGTTTYTGVEEETTEETTGDGGDEEESTTSKPEETTKAEETTAAPETTSKAQNTTEKTTAGDGNGEE